MPGTIYSAEQASSPGTPASGRVALYFKTDGFWYYKDDAGTEFRLVPSSAADLTPGHLFGLTLSNSAGDPTNDIDVATGTARDSADTYDMALLSAITKRLDAAWAVGTGNGGLDTGAIADATYHVFLIKRSDTGVVDALFSLSATAPTMPANYDAKRRIGSIVRASAAIRTFKQFGDLFTWSVPISDWNTTNPGTSAVTRTLSVPTGIVVLGWFSVAENNQSNNRYVLFTALDQTDTVPSATLFTLDLFSSANTVSRGGDFYVKTNTSGQIRYRTDASGASDATKGTTKGWIDLRGRAE